MKQLIYGFLLGVLSLSIPMMAAEKNEEQKEMTTSSNTFALEMYTQLPKGQNLCFSPYSISSAFAMVYLGSRGDTQKEIGSVFHYPESMEKMSDGWGWFNKFFAFYPSNATDDVRLRVANSLWIQTNFPVLPSYREAMAKNFNSSFRFVDFKGQNETARTTINAWVKQNTYGKITDILSPEAIDSSTRLVLISALYLKAKWKNPFDIHLTSQQPFFTHEGTVKTALSMTQTAYYPYYDTPEVALLEMPYIPSRKGGPEFSMLIILPHQKEGLTEVEKGLTIEKMEEWMKNLQSTRLIVTLPKFKVLQSSPLNQIFSNLGMKRPFSDEADFSGMTGVKGLKIGNVLHKVYLSVDETGSEAAAATAIEMQATSVREQKPPLIFQIDHPFLYCIFEKTTGMILFMGRVTDPNQN